MSNRTLGSGILTLVVAAGTASLALETLARSRRKRRRSASDRQNAFQSQTEHYAVSGKTVTINRPRQELYDFWRDFTNLTFMENIDAIDILADGKQRWTLRAPFGQTITLDTEIAEERNGEFIAWKSVYDSPIHAEGSVTFVDAPTGRGTEVESVIAYEPPAGEVGRWIAKLFGQEPAIQGRRELKRFKMLMETGEIADSRYTTEQ